MSYTLDLSHGRELKDVKWPAELCENTTWEVPIKGGKFVVVLPGGRRLTCHPERVFIEREDNALWNIWMVFPKSGKEQVVAEAAMLCDQMGMAEKRSIVAAIEQAALRPGEMTSIYEKIISSKELAASEISSLSIDARGTGYKESPLRLHWQMFFENESVTGESSDN